MQISLIALRLEVADDCENPVKFTSFTAPSYQLPSERQQHTFASIISRGPSELEQSIFEILPEQRGSRHLHDIILETYKIEELDQGDMEPNKAEPADEKNEKMVSGGERSPSSISSVTKRHQEGSQVPLDQERPCPVREGSGTPSFRSVSYSPVTKSGSIPFYSGNPCVEQTKGIMHIFKDNQKTSMEEGVARSPMICMLAVPASHTIHDLLEFTAPVSKFIEQIRIIRDSTPNQFMVLLKFRDQKYADEFFADFNNKPFNTIEPDICYLVYVAKVELIKESEGACLPIPGMTELPICPVCLERMEESVDGVLTVLCNHTFHTKCLAQWGDTSCPVCRYCQTPDEVVDNKCMKCSSQESLWICLICGHIGCGRYVQLHAYRHFQETNHTYAMQLGNNQVWDYAGDNYVHRLIQNKSDGKLVQVDESGNPLQEEKLDALSTEYTYLLTTQLDSQRLYFEEQLAKTAEEAETRVSEIKERLKTAVMDRERFEQELLAAAREKQTLERKCTQMHSRLGKTLTELQEEQEMNKSLRQNQEAWQKRVHDLEAVVRGIEEEKNKEVAELRDQLQDIMFHLEGQQKLATSTDLSQQEIQDGQVIIGAAAPSASSSRRSRKKYR